NIRGNLNNSSSNLPSIFRVEFERLDDKANIRLQRELMPQKAAAPLD
uniref:Type VI secretion system contractile sheath small subunit n=1 Tax=Mesocestoides corti TaxID=53468 RepID=A0A5K3EIL8_MESCO